MDIRRVVSSVLVTVFLLAGSTITLAIEDHDEHEELFRPVVVENGTILSLQDCVALAFKNSPKIRRKKYELDYVSGGVWVARSQYFPVISAGVGFYNENNSDSVYYDKHYRDLPAVGVSINQLVWNFGKTSSLIKMKQFYKIGAEYEFMDSLCATLFDVKWKYYNVLRKKAILDIAKENVRLQKEIIKMMDGRHPDYDNAQGVLNSNNIEYIEAEQAYKNALVDLNNAMYFSGKTKYDIKQTDTFSYFFPDDMDKWKKAHKVHENHLFNFKREDAAKIAYENSPDLHALIATKDAMEQNLKYVKRTILPDLNANVGYGYNHTLKTSNNGLHVGVSLDTSMNLMEQKYNIGGAQAQLNIAENEVDLFKKDLDYSIQRAFNNIDRAEEQLPYARANVYMSDNTYNITKRKYKSNLVDYVAVQNAKLDYITSNKGYVERLYEYNTALIQLEMAMHFHIVDIHQKSEHAMHYHSAELIEHLNKVLDCDETHNKSKGKKSKLNKSSNSL